MNPKLTKTLTTHKQALDNFTYITQLEINAKRLRLASSYQQGEEKATPKMTTKMF